MDIYSDYSSSVSEDHLQIENLSPTIFTPHPIDLNLSDFLPPISILKLSSKTKSIIKYLLDISTVKELHKLLFWQIFYKKFKPDSTKSLQAQTSKLLGSHYIKLLLINMSKNIESGLEYLPIMIGHAIHHEIFDLFKLSNYSFDMRFIIDCYKIIYQEIIGMTVTDSFILDLTKKVFGSYFLKYTQKVRKKIEPTTNLLNKKYEKQMEELPGGIEFAKELAVKLRPAVVKIEPNGSRDEEKVRLNIADNNIAERVKRQLSEPMLKKSSIEDNAKMFNCVKLSPILSRQINSSTVFLI